MFTIEQAGGIKRVNTIDELIIEYIKQYATSCGCKCNNGNNLGSSLNTEELKELLEPYAKLTNLDEYAKTEDLPDMTLYAKKEDLSEIPTVLKNSELQLNIRDQLSDEMFQKLMADDVKPLSAQASMCLTSMAANEGLQAALDSCAREYVSKEDLPKIIEQVKSEIPEIIEGQTTIQFTIANNTILDLDYDPYHILIEQYGLDIVSSNSFYTGHYVHADYSYNDNDDEQPSQILRIDGSSSGLWILYQSHELINPGTNKTHTTTFKLPGSKK